MTDLQIKCFLILAEKLNFTRAAEELNIAQSTLSAHIVALEKDINLCLFIRTNRKVFLSPEGEIMLNTFKNMNQELEKGLEEARSLHNNHSELLRIGYMQGLEPNLFLNKIIDDFREDYPSANVEIHIMNNNDLIDGIDTFELDIVFTLDHVFYSRPDLEGKIIYETPISIVYLEKGNKNKSEKLTIKDFSNEKFIVLSKTIDSTEHIFLQNTGEKIGFKINDVLEVCSVDLQFLDVELGFGVALCNHISRFYTNPKFSSINIPDMYSKIVAISKKKHPTPMIKLFQRYFP